MAKDYVKALDKAWRDLPEVHRVDNNVVDEMYQLMKASKRQKALMAMERERRHRKQNHLDPSIPSPRGRFAGRQDITDIPTDRTLEEILLDQTGRLHEYGTPWVCDNPHCRAIFQMAFPPELCPRCGKPSVIESRKINLRR